jgi:antitoxin component YwqK of YwqJK toxin-antitoxin module
MEAVGSYERGRQVGLWVGYHKNGQKRYEGELAGPNRTGPWVFWHQAGQKQSEGEFVRGKRQGAWRGWTRSGADDPEVSGVYLDGERVQ